ncbi:unnamed protein product [Anisakis simplex]|uniref:F-box/FBD/LRR-repeat protein n=1 Tax=Anisakis simplex TaxID=6269 RepID=A0A0M3JHB7_ANISI|nr:unnamed protein product [Anisakis simplex]
MTIFEVCPRLKNLEIALTCTPLSKHHIAIPYTWRRNILRTRQTALTHFRLYLREIEDPSGLRVRRIHLEFNEFICVDWFVCLFSVLENLQNTQMLELNLE